MQHLDFLSLHCFIEAARTGSIRKASEQLYMTPSAVSRRISGLEERLKTKLFMRTPSGVTLTATGIILFKEADFIAQKVSKIQNVINTLEDKQKEKINIYYMEGAVDQWIAEIVSFFNRNNPNISFDLNVASTEDSIAALVEGKCDIAIVLRAPRHPEIKIVKSGAEPMFAIAAPEHEISTFCHLSFTDLLNYDLALPKPGFGVRQLFDRKLAQYDAMARVTYTANSIALVKSIVRNGRAVTLLPFLSARHECKLGLLKAIPLVFEDSFVAHIDVCINKNQELTQVNIDMLKLLEKSFSCFVTEG